MKLPSELEGLLYGGGLLVAVGASTIYAPAGLITLGVWFGLMAILYLNQGGKGDSGGGRR